MSWRVLLGLIACNAIWATNPLMGKILMREVPAMQVSWLRYASALVASLLFLALLSRHQRGASWQAAASPRNLPWVVFMGLVTFCGSGIVQYKGLALSTSTANSLIVATEPIFAVFLAWAFLRERIGLVQIAAFVLALSGFGLLSNLHPGDIAGSLAGFSFGNLLLLFSMPMEAMYTIISRKLAGRVSPLPLFVGALGAGFLALTAFVLASGIGLPSPFSLSWQGLGALLWLGPLGTAATYIYWSVALTRAPVAAVCLTLFVQPIQGAIFGITLLGEKLSWLQGMGGLLILAALVLQTSQTLKEARQ